MSLEKAEIGNHQENNFNNEESKFKATAETITRVEPKLGRNDLVKISNGQETKELKYKKAKPLIETGEWKII